MVFICLTGDKEDKQDSLMKGKDSITSMVSQAYQEHTQAGILHRGIVLSLKTFDRVNLYNVASCALKPQVWLFSPTLLRVRPKSHM